MACDPNTLLEQAKCLNACIPQGMQQAAGLALLCNIVDAGGGGGGGVESFNARTGAVTLLLADVSAVADSRYVLKAGDTMTGPLILDLETAGSSLIGLQVDIQDDPDDGATAFRVRLWNGASFDTVFSINKDGATTIAGSLSLTSGSLTAPVVNATSSYSLNGSALFAPQSIYASGTAYTLTNAIARVDFGTTDPTLNVAVAGTFRLKGRVVVNLVGATFAANQTLTVRLRNATSATDYTDSTTVYTIPIVTTMTNTLAVIELPEVFVALAAADQVQLFAGLSATPSAGSVQIVAASITAFRTSL